MSRVTSLTVILVAAGCEPEPSPPPIDASPDVRPAAAELMATRAKIEFGSTSVSTAIGPESVIFTNIGGTSTSSLAFTLEPNGEFVIAGSCATPLGPGESCLASIAFLPSTTGSKRAKLGLSDGLSSASVELDGVGASAEDLFLAPSTMSFGSRDVGQTSGARSFTITNSGAYTVGALTLSVGGSNPGDFTIASDTCTGTSLVPGAMCSTTVTFHPTAAGLRAATLTFIAHPGPELTGQVSGTGVEDLR